MEIVYERGFVLHGIQDISVKFEHVPMRKLMLDHVKKIYVEFRENAPMDSIIQKVISKIDLWGHVLKKHMG